MRRKLRPSARRKGRSPVLLGAVTAAVLLGLGASAEAAPFAYVTSGGGDSVFQFDVGTGGLLSPLSPATVATGDRAGAVAVSPDGQSVYVVNNPDNTVSQYSAGADGALSPKSPATVAAGYDCCFDGPSDLAVTPDGQTVYVLDAGYLRGAGGVFQYSVGVGGVLPATWTSATHDANPSGVAVSPDGQSLYVTHFDTGTVHQYDVLPDGELSFKSPAFADAGLEPTGVVVSPDGQSVYVTDTTSSTILQYDVGASGKLSPKSPAEVPTGDGAGAVAVSPDGRSVYAISRYGGAIFQYDVGPGGGLSPKDPPAVAAEGAYGVAVDQDGQSVYVTNGTGVLQYDVGPGGKLSPKSPPTVAAAGGFGVAVSPPLNHPLTTITGGPIAVTNDPTPTFTLSSSEPGSSFECKRDSGSYAACSSPKTTAHLTDGRHTFYVRAKDPGGNVDPTPALRTFTVGTATVGVSGSSLVVTAAPGAKDNLRITKPSASKLRVTDLASGAYTGSGLHTGAKCTRSGDNSATCNAAGITSVKVVSGDQADQVTNSTGSKSSVNGGPGNDTLQGGSNSDTLTGAAGADVLKGMNGNDLLLARDGASDQTIECGGGSDKADLDKLPKDPNSVVSGCETKSRY